MQLVFPLTAYLVLLSPTTVLFWILRDQKCVYFSDKPFIYSKTVFVFSHPAVDLWRCPSVVWTHPLSSCCLAFLQRDASVQKKQKKPSSFSVSLQSSFKRFSFQNFLLFFYPSAALLHFGPFVRKPVFRTPSSTPGCIICHYEVFGFATWSHCKVHVCTCVSVILAFHTC